MEEQKEYELEIETLKQEIEKLLKLINIDVTKYEL